MLEHSGTKGQKWGQRRYQYADGSLTPLGREHYGVGKPRSDSTSKRSEPYHDSARQKGESKKKYEKRIAQERKAAINQMTNKELRDFIERTELMNQYYNLTNPTTKSKVDKGKSMVSQMLEKGAVNAGSKVVESLATFAIGSLINSAANKPIVKTNEDKPNQYSGYKPASNKNDKQKAKLSFKNDKLDYKERKLEYEQSKKTKPEVTNTVKYPYSEVNVNHRYYYESPPKPEPEKKEDDKK